MPILGGCRVVVDGYLYRYHWLPRGTESHSDRAAGTEERRPQSATICEKSTGRLISRRGRVIVDVMPDPVGRLMDVVLSRTTPSGWPSKTLRMDTVYSWELGACFRPHLLDYFGSSGASDRLRYAASTF
jgi:hypothetical protein